ncbi:hypothetical protein EVAR_59848_1 [Eumeta japonica]|uniref:Uncharacterized protein n=1 Tax=Eumeta variegata TaxID=151549 RepID=A0A4C1Z905_EUMVA|nr:hypothetical protein EVAR_59848_1 [Eumeta japonica]
MIVKELYLVTNSENPNRQNFWYWNRRLSSSQFLGCPWDVRPMGSAVMRAPRRGRGRFALYGYWGLLLMSYLFGGDAVSGESIAVLMD